MVRGLRHSREAIFTPDLGALARVCELATHSFKKGARLWSVVQLGVLKESSSEPALSARLTDEAGEVRSEAAFALRSLVRAHPELVARALAAAKLTNEQQPSDSALVKALAT